MSIDNHETAAVCIRTLSWVILHLRKFEIGLWEQNEEASQLNSAGLRYKEILTYLNAFSVRKFIVVNHKEEPTKFDATSQWDWSQLRYVVSRLEGVRPSHAEHNTTHYHKLSLLLARYRIWDVSELGSRMTYLFIHSPAQLSLCLKWGREISQRTTWKLA